MKSFFAGLVLLTSLCCCGQAQAPVNIPIGDTHKPAAGESVAYFAEGCFWHSEIIFQSLAGVRDAVSGYAGGTTKNPSYEAVGSGKTGHAETVQVFYDPTKISYETLVKAFFASQDPTQVNRQGRDVGTEYRSIAFYTNEQEKKTIQSEIDKIQAAGTYSKPIATQVMPLKAFYPAEDYHQEYVVNHPNNPYVRSVSIPDFVEFKHTFKGKFKK